MSNFIDDRKERVEYFKKLFRNKTTEVTKKDIPIGLFIKCENCNELIFNEDLEKNLDVCPKCSYHFKINAIKRLTITLDNNSFCELFANIKANNPLNFPDYDEKIQKYQQMTNEFEAFICGTGLINKQKVAIGVLDSFFMMGSMGTVVGEKVTKLIEYSIEHRLPLIIFSASGGARMQEGIYSLMQMAKTSAAIKLHDMEKLLFISILTNPTTGGVLASYASLGDIIIAEKDSLIGFAGQRVIKQTINQDLPEGFQTDQFQLQHGFVDMVVSRHEIKDILSRLIKLHSEDK